jgi:hypothetical protein
MGYQAFGAALIADAPVNLDAARLNETHTSRNIAKLAEKGGTQKTQILLIEQRPCALSIDPRQFHSAIPARDLRRSGGRARGRATEDAT